MTWERFAVIFYTACITIIGAYVVTKIAAPSFNECIFRGVC